MYLVTLAPGVTFWDAGELIASAHVFGVPHPPGTPLYIALGRAWTMLLGPVLGVARAMNLLSAVSTAMAAALTAQLVLRESASTRRSAAAALAGALCAGLMLTAWSNATETEVYAVALLHVVLMLTCAAHAVDDARWAALLAYLIALAPALHLIALVGAPAAIMLASRTREMRWRPDRLVMLAGILLCTAGVGRMSAMVAGAGVAACAASLLIRRDDANVRGVISVLGLAAIAASALFIMLLRARHDPGINQGEPATLAAMADVVARRQYDVPGLWPRRAPLWLQAATLGQYVDWQFAWTWGRGIFATPLRAGVTLLFVVLGASGWRAMRHDARRLAEALALLLLCGSVGAAVYLNLRSGASIGYGFVPASAHEARERDYFFVLAFWPWGILAGYGAVHLVRSRGWPAWVGLAAPCIPLVANWPAADRSHGEGASAPRIVAASLLTSAPRDALLFVSGDNDTYPLWYLQQVEGVRRDVTVVTIPLLPAGWYVDQLARRTRLSWPAEGGIAGARWQHQETAARIAEAARAAGRPVVASPSVPSEERALLGSRWTLSGSVYEATARADGSALAGVIMPRDAPAVSRRAPRRGPALPDDVSGSMLRLLECGRIAALPTAGSALRDSLEVSCNLR